MKELNIGLIKDALSKYRQATRVELSAITQISQPTVNVLISQLLKEKTVVSLGMAQSTGGRKAEVFALNNKQSCIASFAAEKTDLQYLVTDFELQKEAAGREIRNQEESSLEQLCRMIRQVLSANKYIRAITVGVPGAVSAQGEVFAIPRIPEWENLNLKAFLEQEFSLAVTVVNDINAIAVGYAYSVKDGTQNMVYLHVGENGIGAGIIIDGKLYPGFKSFAGEVGCMLTGEEADEMAILKKIIVNLVCILNPEKIVIEGGKVTVERLETLYEDCLSHLPKGVMPRFVAIESGVEYYFKGLGQSGRELLDENIRLA